MAAIIRDREDNSRHVHPEFATPMELAFWLRQFRDLANTYATDLEARAKALEDLHA